jgi:hypothetical protein
MGIKRSEMVSNNGKFEKVRGKAVPVAFLLARISLEMHCIVFNGK